MDDVAYVWEARYRDAEDRRRAAVYRAEEAEATIARVRQLADWLAMDPDNNNAAAKAIRATLGDQP